MPRKKFRTAQRKNKADITPNNQPSRKKETLDRYANDISFRRVQKEKNDYWKDNKRFNVPKTTLHDRISGRVQHGTMSGSNPYLQAHEEEALVKHLISAAKQGYGKTRKQVNITVEMVAKSKGVLRKDKISNGWWRRFVERQPEVSLRRADSTAHIRMESVNKESISYYFYQLESTFTENSLIDSPGQIYNMDETGMPLDPRPPNIIAKSGQKKVNYRQSGKKEQITVIECGNAAGQSIPPMVIFEENTLTTNGQWVKFLEPCMA